MTTAITTIRRDRYSVEPGNDVYTFTVGAAYYGNLTCSHCEYKVVCIKRTAKTVWLCEVIPSLVTQDGTVHRGESWELPRRSKVKWDQYGGKTQEITSHGNWSIYADATNNASAPNC
jgi:hypothetical protein